MLPSARVLIKTENDSREFWQLRTFAARQALD